jgi:hypothetical protein
VKKKVIELLFTGDHRAAIASLFKENTDMFFEE